MAPKLPPTLPSLEPSCDAETSLPPLPRSPPRRPGPQPRPLRLIVPYPPGGPLDIAARALADKVKDSLGVVVVENRPGAGGNVGADAVAKSAPDGSAIVMGAVATHAINPWLYSKMPYDALRDFTPITLVAQVPNVLVMNADAAQRLGIAIGARPRGLCRRRTRHG